MRIILPATVQESTVINGDLRRIPDKKFTLRTFCVYYEQDINKFEKLVKDAGGIWDGFKQVSFLNVWNQPVTRQYLCIYHLDYDIEMEVLC